MEEGDGIEDGEGVKDGDRWEKGIFVVETCDLR